MRSTTADYVPAILFLLASGLLIPFFYLLSNRGSTSFPFAVQISAIIMLTIIAALICGTVVRDVRFYAYVIAAIGIALRAASVILLPVSSNVLAFSARGAALILSGQNPYVSSTSKFVYPPLEPLFYIPFLGVDLRWAEFASGSVIVLVLLYTSLRSENPTFSLLYLGLYCFSTLMSGFVGISTNDTSASLFPFLAMWLIMFSSSRCKFDFAGVLLGLGVAFKQFGIFPLIFVIGFLIIRKGPWVRTAVLASLTIALVSFPFLFSNPMGFLYDVISFHLAERTASPFYVLVALNPQFLGPWLLALQLSLTAGLGAFLLWRIRNWSECQIAWTSVLLLSLFLGRYFAPSYFAFIMPFWILAGMGLLINSAHSAGRSSSRF